ncbi:MAG: MBL fold metallo-hydrolase [Betaproteobacteria bacterium]|jgi:glyoxylase-like metal-dependent hydrolase (beta-lactamase superfamily II)/rhodanese-related sulfurtransferase|nr:MBL fold metallo-hydrolase [Betaproteobacteria bacterium]
MLVKELNRGKCKTYLVACETSGNAALIDPLRDHIDRYLALLAYHGYKLAIVIDTHTHADHRTGSFDLNELTGAEVVMHREAPAPRVGRHVGDGDTLFLGELALGILATPGHTPDSMSIVVDGRVFTGDTLLIRGTGRADFAGGDAGAQYDSITGKLFALPDSTIVLPAHDYRGNTESTIGEEKRLNPRLAGKSRADYVALMENLGLPLPTQIQEVLQPNQTAIDDDALKFPTLAQLSEVRQLTPQEVQALGSGPAGPTILDVREPDEFTGPLGHIPGSQLIPLKELARRVDELEPSKQRRLIAVCRSGVRSTTAAAILTSMGFEQVFNMKGGMLAWNDAKLPVKR